MFQGLMSTVFAIAARRSSSGRRVQMAWAGLVIGCLPAFACAGDLAGEAAPSSAAELLARARLAVGMDLDGTGPVESMLRCERWIGEERTPFRLTFDRDGRFRQEPERRGLDDVSTRAEPGQSGSCLGYDGEVAWLADVGGARLHLPAGASHSAMLSVWSQTLFWLSPRAPLTFEDTVVAVAGGYMIGFVMELGGSAVLKGEVEIADGLALPRAIRWGSDDRVTEHQILGYRVDEGHKLPRRIVIRRGDSSAGELRTLERGAAPIFLGNPYEPGAMPFTRADFNGNRGPAAVVKRQKSGHLLVKVEITGRDMGWFLFDSGSSTDILDRQVATRLGLEAYGDATIQGLAGQQKVQFVRAPTMQIGPLYVEDTEFSVMDLRFLQQAFGTKIAGLIGYDLLCRAVVEVDVAAPAVRLFDPESYQPPRDVEWIPISLNGRHATTIARVDGHRARCIVDTGSDAAIALRREFADTAGLAAGEKSHRSHIKGVTTRVPVTIIDLDWIAIGPQRMEGPVALIFDMQEDRRIGEYSDGLLGAPLFEGWTLILDYPRRQIAITPAR